MDEESIKNDGMWSPFTSRHNLTNFASANNDHASALKNYKLVLDAVRQSGRKQFEGLALGNMGEVARRMGQLDDADQYLHQSIKIAHEAGDLELALTNSLNRGQVQEDRQALNAPYRGVTLHWPLSRARRVM